MKALQVGARTWYIASGTIRELDWSCKMRGRQVFAPQECDDR